MKDRWEWTQDEALATGEPEIVAVDEEEDWDDEDWDDEEEDDWDDEDDDWDDEDDEDWDEDDEWDDDDFVAPRRSRPPDRD